MGAHALRARAAARDRDKLAMLQGKTASASNEGLPPRASLAILLWQLVQQVPQPARFLAVGAGGLAANIVVFTLFHLQGCIRSSRGSSRLPRRPF